MSGTSGKSLAQLKAEKKKLEAQGKTASTSKSLGKIIQAIKVLEPHKYSDKQVESAQQNLKLINEPVVSGPTGTSTTTTPKTSTPSVSTSTTTSGTSDLEKTLADKQAALTTATKNINDNPWYSEATRVGKIAKLNDIAQIEITNLQNQINSQKASEQQAFQNDIATQQLALQTQAANQPKTTTTLQTDASGNVVSVTIDTTTGKVISKQSLGAIGVPQKSSGGDGTKELTTEQKTAIINKNIAKATSIFEMVDKGYNDYSAKDMYLSRDEQQSIKNQLLALVGEDESLADELFNNIWNSKGYHNWGN